MMYFLQFQGTCAERGMTAGGGRMVVRCWVDADDEVDAEARARRDIQARGCQAHALEVITATSRDDYFPPCESLEAFQRAEQSGSSYLFKPAV